MYRRVAIVSIPFIAGQWSLRGLALSEIMRALRSFNPLHCGAVVASEGVVSSLEGSACVSIPFIAGQWSLRSVYERWVDEAGRFQSPSLRGSGRFARRQAEARAARLGFNPLHCGAVVASRGAGGSRTSWKPCFNPLHCGAVVASDAERRAARIGADRFNPLHCGAVVASDERTLIEALQRAFQSPSLRGSGRFNAHSASKEGGCWKVSIPFIAGQWSLEALQRALPALPPGFNPLHCGAVVASATTSPRPGAPSRFNPLHCGAVVA